jgi:4-hydroxybenzoate polyprenyltransferase
LSRALVELIRTRYPIPKHLLYAVIWYGALLGAMRLAAGQDRPEWGLRATLGTLTVFLLFLFMRVVDEIRDLEYDRVYNPSRALARGAVSLPQAGTCLVVTGLVIALINATFGALVLALLLGIMAHCFVLVALEKISPLFERALFLNTAVGILLKTGTVYYVYLMHEFDRGPLPLSALAVAVASIGGYLHWEVSRKVVRPDHALPGEKLYSREVGWPLGLLISFGSLVVALAAYGAWSFEAGEPVLRWLPFLAVAPSLVGLARFTATHERFSMGTHALVSYVVFLLGLALVGWMPSAG